MKRRTFLFIFLTLAVFFVVAFMIFLSNVRFNLTPVEYNSTLSPSSSLSPCKTIAYSGEKAINIVFFADQKTSEKYRDFFISVEPFKSHIDQFNFFYIDTWSPSCSLYQNIAVFCYSSDMVKKAASCPNDYIVAFDDKDSSIRSSSYLNVMSINVQHPLSVLQHEFGHTFASLADEYVPANLPPSAKNCVMKCEKFGNDADGCFLGCAEQNYYRSIDEGVMRTLNSENYGLFDGKLISGIIEEKSPAKITGLATDDQTANCLNQKYYLVVGDYSNNIFVVLNKSLEVGCAGGNGGGSYSYTLNEGNKNVSENFEPSLVYTDAPPSEPNKIDIDGQVFTYNGTLALKLPAQKDITGLSIYDAQKKRIEIVDINNYTSFEANIQDIDSRACKI